MTKQLLIAGIIMITFSMTKSVAQIQPNDVEKIVEKARTKFGLPSVAVSIISSDSILHTEIQGVRKHDKTEKVTDNDFFHIGSCSKSVLAFIAAKLIEENKINWDTHFFDIYPELKDSALIDYHSITLEDLFLCKAGILPYTSGEEVFPEIDEKSKNTRYDFAKWLVQQKPVSVKSNGKFEFLYSNAGYTMASLMIERVSNKNYNELIDQYIVNELNIDVFIGFPNKLNPDQPWGHTVNNNGIEVFPPDHNYSMPELLIPAGDLSMQPEGFAKYIQLNLQGLKGCDNIITAAGYQYIHYGHQGFAVGVFNSKMFGLDFSGLDGSAGTFFYRAILIPETNFAFTIMTNAGSGTGEMKAVDWITMKIVKKNFKWWWKFWI